MAAMGSLVNIYSLVIVVRIILSWISWMGDERIFKALAWITDPYLKWFRRFTFLRLGFLDLSPIAALGVLTLISRAFNLLAYSGTITIGIILYMLLQVLWGAVSFLLGFLIIILILRLIAHYTKQNLNNPFWNIVAAISQPVLKKTNQIFFRDQIVLFRNGVIISIVILGLLYLVLGFLVHYASIVLAKLPV